MADGAMAGTSTRGGGTAWRESKLAVVSGSDRLVERAIEDGPVERRVGELACACLAEGTMP